MHTKNWIANCITGIGISIFVIGIIVMVYALFYEKNYLLTLFAFLCSFIPGSLFCGFGEIIDLLQQIKDEL